MEEVIEERNLMNNLNFEVGQFCMTQVGQFSINFIHLYHFIYNFTQKNVYVYN